MLKQGDNTIEDFSASSTLLMFDPPLPLLRGPLPAGLSDDDPSLGPFVLAFKDDRAWNAGFRACKSKIRDQCEGGARIGCSISASSKCKPPWWRTLLGGATVDYSERERCEEREMTACIAASKESCLNFAQEKCIIPFRDARIFLISQKEISKSISQAASNWAAINYSSHQQPSSVCSLEVTNYRGSALLDPGSSPK